MPAYAENKILALHRLTRFKKTLRTHESIGLWYVLLTLLLCLPVVFTTYIPLVDYPNHLARADMLARYHQVLSFRSHYRLLIQPIPNLAMDLVIPLIARFTGTIMAGKLFLIALFLLYSFGCYLLSFTIFGYDTRAAFIPLLFIYNSTLLMGFVNYAVGVALFLITFALWLRWKDRWTIARFAGFSALACACYLSHLSSIAILGLSTVAVMSWELFTRRARWTQLLITGCAALPAVFAYLAFMRGSGHIGSIELNTLSGKLIGLLGIVRGYDLTFDLLLVFGLVACFAYLALSRMSVSVNPIALLPALVLFLAFAACPLAMYTSSGADVRFVWPAFVLLALSFRIRTPKRKYAFCLGFIVAVYIIRFAAIWWNWHQEDVTARAIVQSFDKLPRQATLYPAFFDSGGVNAVKQSRGLASLACYAVITRDAFVPSVFALSGQQPLIFKGHHPFHVWEKKISTRTSISIYGHSNRHRNSGTGLAAPQA